jgi:hypothetical protein
MTMPRFTAEKSLSRTTRSYISGRFMELRSSGKQVSAALVNLGGVICNDDYSLCFFTDGGGDGGGFEGGGGRGPSGECLNACASECEGFQDANAWLACISRCRSLCKRRR